MEAHCAGKIVEVVGLVETCMLSRNICTSSLVCSDYTIQAIQVKSLANKETSKTV